jgi:hypothetical protein
MIKEGTGTREQRVKAGDLYPPKTYHLIVVGISYSWIRNTEIAENC